jgi:hypothetical protein
MTTHQDTDGHAPSSARSEELPDGARFLPLQQHQGPTVRPVADGRPHRRPDVDVTRLLVTAQLVVGAVVVADRLARRPAAAQAVVTMGPGGWVSMKGGGMVVRPSARLWRRQPLRSGSERPLWARLLRATALESLVR